ncbi:MAG: hypothetical protein KA764_15640 [Anaerolineales bacterium]|nr:hypothetical protein [Anaerolineales bacterium]
MTAGALLQLPAQWVVGPAGPPFTVMAISGALLLGAGLLWLGRVLWLGPMPAGEEPRLPAHSRYWAGPTVMLIGLLLGLDAIVNIVGGLSLAGGLIHLLYYTGLAVAGLGLRAAPADRSGRLGLAGFVLLQLGATLAVIPALFFVPQLAGILPDNRALMAAWSDIPIGRAGLYLVILGWLLCGAGMIRAGVAPRWSGWLIVSGVALALPVEFGVQAYAFGIFWVIGAVLAGAGVIARGRAILSRQDRLAP